MLARNGIALLSLLSITLAGSGCAALDRTRPKDMTVAEHREAAREWTAAAERAEHQDARTGRGEAQWRANVNAMRSLAARHAAAADRREQEVGEAASR